MADLSPQQQAAVAYAASGRGSLVLDSKAGTGKTYTIEQMWRVLPESAFIQCFAFNVTIAKELNERIARLRKETGRDWKRLQAGTFHSKGMGALRKWFSAQGIPDARVRVEGNKLYDLFRAAFDGSEELAIYGDVVPKLVAFGKGELLTAASPDCDWMALYEHHDLYFDDERADEAVMCTMARDLVANSEAAAKQGYIDFDDMLYLPLIWNLKLWQNDIVIVDEVQDTNKARREFARRSLRSGGRFLGAGDRNQAIYGFTGASHDAMDLVIETFQAKELPLSVSFRCSKAVIRQAQQVVPTIEYAPGAPEGEVKEMKLKDAMALLGPHDAILCRQTAPLIKLALHLLSHDYPCTVLGREIAEGLVKLIRKMKARDIDALEERLEAYRERETTKLLAKGLEAKAEAINDRVRCILVIAQNLPENDRTVGALIGKLEAMFSDDAPVLQLATQHKAKGREWPVVCVLRPDLNPSKWARKEWQAQQELNLIYVRDTRAKLVEIFLTTETLAK